MSATNQYSNIPGYGAVTWKSHVDTAAELPAGGNTAGDARVVLSPLRIYIWNGSAWSAIGGGGGTTDWGDIGGVLSNQTDLQAALDAKAPIDGYSSDNFVGTSSAGVLETITNWVRNAFGGATVSQNISLPDTGGGSLVLNRIQTDLAATANTSDSYFQESDYMNANGVVDYNNLILKDYGLNINSTGVTNDSTVVSSNINLGNGTDVSSSNTVFGINSNVTTRNNHTTNNTQLENLRISREAGSTANSSIFVNASYYSSGDEVSVTGMNFSANIQPGATLDYLTAFNANINLQEDITNYTGTSIYGNGSGVPDGFTGASIFTDFSASLASFSGMRIDTSSTQPVTNFNGIEIYGHSDGQYYNGVNISPTIASLSDNMSCVNINPTVAGDLTFAAGVNVNMDNVSVFPGVASSLIVQDLTYEAEQVGVDGDNVSIEYTSGGTAGSEVVSVTGFAISVQIQSGVSTATQIKTALDASLPASTLINVIISGVGSNPQTTVAATNLAGGEYAGQKYAGYFDGDVSITGSLQFNGALSIGALSSFATQEIVDGGGTPSSIDTLITAPFVPANTTVANADTLAVNTAALIQIGDNSVVTTAFLGVAALGLPAVLSMGTGSSIDRVEGAVFALSLDASATGGTADIVALCRAIAIPNGVTTVNRLYGYEFSLPFGDPGTDSWGLYISSNVNNWLEGGVKLGGTAGSTDLNAGHILNVEGSALFDGNLGFYGTAPIAQPASSGPATAGVTYTATEQAMLQEAYNALRALGLMS